MLTTQYNTPETQASPDEPASLATPHQLDSAPFDAEHPNAEFIRVNLPAWYSSAPAALRQALHASQQKARRSAQALEPVRNRLLSAQAFAAPVLSQAFFERFKLALDVEAFQLMTWRYDSAWKPAPLEQTLLQAALQNFALSNRSRFDPYSAILRTGGLRYWLIDAAQRRYKVEYHDRQDISLEQFADFCHELDLGSQYQTHLDSVFKPASPDAAKAVASAFIDSERDAVEVLAHLALMKGDITDAAYQMLLNAVKSAVQPKWDGKGLRYCQLHMLDTYAFSGCLLHGALLIQQDVPDPDSGPCLVYMPSEPSHPIKQYASIRAFNASLVQAFDSDTYRHYFSRFISLSQSPEFFTRLESRLYPAKNRTLDVNADLVLKAQSFSEPPFELLYEHLLSKTYGDSRAIAVPSAHVDQQAQDALLESLKNNGMNLLNAAGLFVPVLGEVMALVALYQLASEVFVAYEDWTHGEHEEAMQHVYNIGENVAQMLVVGTVIGAVNALEPSMFIESLVQKRVDGSVRLGKPTVDAFADPVRLPEDLSLDALGLYEHDGKMWLPLGGKLYRVEPDASRAYWRIKHPSNERSYSPRLTHNGAGAWRHEWENPMGWDEVTAFKRLNATCNAFTEDEVRKVLRITGSNEALLRQIHVENYQPPALLRDAIQRVEIERELQGCIDTLNAEDLSAVSVSHIEPWMKLLVSSPRWQKARGLLLIDADGVMLDAWNTGSHMTLSSHVVGPTSDLSQVLGQLLDGMTPGEITLLTGSGSTDKAVQVRALKNYLADYAQRHVERLIDGVYALKSRTGDPLVELIQRDFSSLPSSVALEIIDMASEAEKTQMASTKRIPLTLAEHAREYQQQLRINRANEGFYRSSTDNPDTYRAGLGVLQYVPGWRGDISIDLLRDTLEGDEISSIGSDQATAMHRILVKTEKGFQSFNPSGDSLGEVNPRFFSALLNILPDEVRSSIELPLNADEQQLRSLLRRMASDRRDRVAGILRIQPVRPGIKWPQRLPDGRIGYPLSGRLRGFFRRLGIGASSHSPELAVRGLYPDFSDAEVSSFLDQLRAEHTGPASQSASFVRQKLRRLTDELHNLQTTLDAWVAEAALSSQRRPREAAAMRIKSCWKRLSARCRNHQGDFLGYMLDLDNLRVGNMPDISADFSHVVALKAGNMRLNSSTVDAFLGKFKSLQSLVLDFNDLQVIPESVGRMTQLVELSLRHNPLVWTEASNAILQNLHQLEVLDLNFCSIGPNSRLAAVNSLRMLFLRATGIEMLPQWNWRSTDLIRLDLRDNRISEITAQELANLPHSLNENRMRIHLNGNPLSAATLERIRLFRESRLRPRLGISHSNHSLQDAPANAIWLAGSSGEQLAARMELWQGLLASPGSADFFQVLSDLASSADFLNDREDLTTRVWAMIEAATANSELRMQLFDLAAHPQTCGDGLALIFGDMEVRVRMLSIMSSTTAIAQPEEMFRLTRGLDRLDQVEKIARRDIALRRARHEPVDEAEVRLAYRTGLQKRLALPSQSRTMLFRNLAGVSDANLNAAYSEIIAREGTQAFFESLIEREFWISYLEARYDRDFAPAKVPFLQRLNALDELPPNEQSDQQYLDQIALISEERRQAVNDLAISLSRHIAEAVNMTPQ
ncbi:hypothetical protein N018_06360 [Pseudomonas syringae CC1557]|uniref:RING-type E3 ubiquitin transferase n=1 Tax=Pseudomonas syringae CC1557 TaxID=1357279 RepID=W0MSY7_PSESX|nr:NEL-type E3 ubiquitin ligase domain-containing protein [Pseudomonas syringae]AHG39886.1 hypothetical protein N018_06360 [Pseudomonas syringae CC1557]